MPLTPGHPAVVLPLQRLGLPLSALVAGAVAPDAPVYLPVGVGYATTHSGAGLVVDVVLGLLVVWLWFAVVRDALVDLAAPLRARAPARARLDRRGWLLAPLAVAIGAATHVVWDSATHEWGFLVEDITALREQHGPLPLYGWLQHASTVVGSTVVAAYAARRLRELPVLGRPPRVRRPALWLGAVPSAALLAALLTLDPWAAAGAALLALLVVACGWRVVSATTQGGAT